MRRQSVVYKDVSFIIIIVLALEIIVLISYQVVSPQIWQRHTVEDIGGYSIESIGQCYSESGSWFQIAMVVLNVILLFVALVLCWRTKDLPSDFSESNYIFLSVMFMFQVLLLTVPISAMVRKNANVFFFVRMGGVFLQNFSVLMLMFFPKMRRIYMGEDTALTIINAIVESMDGKTQDSAEAFSKDTMNRSNSLVVEGISQSRPYGMYNSIAEEILKPKDLERNSKIKNIHNEELAVNRKGDCRV